MAAGSVSEELRQRQQELHRTMLDDLRQVSRITHHHIVRLSNSTRSGPVMVISARATG